VCDRLVDKKLVRRRIDDDDRRAVLVDLTPRGRKLIEQVMQRRRTLIADILGQLPPASQRRLGEALLEFANAAGEISDEAWTLGWPVTPEAAPNA
jgi:DNA-binding MarR family transcriptional regulator